MSAPREDRSGRPIYMQTLRSVGACAGLVCALPLTHLIVDVVRGFYS